MLAGLGGPGWGGDAPSPPPLLPGVVPSSIQLLCSGSASVRLRRVLGAPGMGVVPREACLSVWGWEGRRPAAFPGQAPPGPRPPAKPPFTDVPTARGPTGPCGSG